MGPVKSTFHFNLAYYSTVNVIKQYQLKNIIKCFYVPLLFDHIFIHPYKPVSVKNIVKKQNYNLILQ